MSVDETRCAQLVWAEQIKISYSKDDWDKY